MDLLMKSQNSSTRKGPWKMEKQTRTHKMEVEKKKNTIYSMYAFPGEVGQACTDWERVRADHPKDFSNRASAELSEAELETFETISQQRQTWSSLYSGQL